jgi:TPR repeat protein/serine/threonine protein kinase/GTPase SAR1 family protein
MNRAKAVELYEKAAALDDMDAMFALSVCLLEGMGTQKDYYRAVELLKKCVESGDHAAALSYLGTCYLEGFGVKKDLAEAFEFFSRGAAENDPRSLYQLAEWYAKKKGQESQSLEYARRAMKLGSADALHFLGVCYLTGRLVLVDMGKAVELLTGAANQGSTRAMNRLGFCHLKGGGVTKKDPKKAVSWFEMAANLEDPVGLYNLANAYANGEGVKKDLAVAFDYFRQAADLGDFDALHSVGLCYADGNGVDQSFARAVELVQKAAIGGCARSWCKLGHWYEFGFGTGDEVVKDIGKSIECFRKGFLAGSKNAETEYRRLILETLPDSVRKGTKRQIGQYVEDIVVGGSEKFARAKVMVLGKEGVGKTHLYRKIRSLPYEVNLSTDGIDVHTFSLKGMDLTWFDFGGQAVFYPTHQFFLTAQCIYLLCFKFGDEESVERTEYWLRNVRNFTRDPNRPAKIVVVGTHVDMLEDDEGQEKVWTRLAPLMDNSHVVGHIATSCRTGEGLEGVVRGIELAMDAANLRAVQVPKSFAMIEAFIKESRKTLEPPKLAWSTVLETFPALTETQLQQALNFFTDMGLCVFDARLKLLILDPQWLANAFSALISFSCRWVKDGVVSASKLDHVWKGLGKGEAEEMMRLLERFELAFPKRLEGQWIIPSLLPLLPEDGGCDFDDLVSDLGSRYSVRKMPGCFERVFKFEVLPFGLFGRLVSRLQEWTDVTLTELWRTGLIMTSSSGDGSRAEIKVVGTSADTRQSLVISLLSSSPSLSASSPSFSANVSPTRPRTLPPPPRFSSHRTKFASVRSKPLPVPKPKTHGESTSLLKRLVEECQNLFQSAFSGGEAVIPQYATCPHCLGSRKSSTGPETVFKVDDCVDALVAGDGTMACGPRLKIPVLHLGDDISFAYVQILGDRDVALEEEPFASGGFGSIYRGTLLTSSRLVAAKEIRAEKVKEGFFEFQREVSLMSRLNNHPNMVELHGVMLSPLRMIIEFCSGGDLLYALRQGKLKENQGGLRFKIALDIAMGMSYLHGQSPPLAHRDLRSPNIFMVSFNEQDPICAKVADLGLTLSVTERMREPLPTWQWMAPEAQMGDSYTESCDLYSFGIVCSEIWQGAGEVPFSEFSTFMRLPEIFLQIREGSLRPTLPLDMEDWMAEMIHKLWASDPAIRPSFYDCATLLLRKRPMLSKALSVSPTQGADKKRISSLHHQGARIGFKRVVKSFERDSIRAICCGENGAMFLLGSGNIEGVESKNASVLGNVSSYVWAGFDDGQVLCLDCPSLQLQLGKSRITLILSVSEDAFLVGDCSGELALVSSTTGSILDRETLGGGAVLCGCVVEDTKDTVWITVAPSTIFVVRLDLVTGTKLSVSLFQERSHTGAVLGMVYPCQHVVWTCDARELFVWDSRTGAKLFGVSFPEQHQAVCMARATCMGGIQSVWIGQRGGLIAVWDARRRVLVCSVPMIENEATTIVQVGGGGSVWVGDGGGRVAEF